MKKRDTATRVKKARFTAGMGRFIIDALALGSRIITGEDIFRGK